MLNPLSPNLIKELDQAKTSMFIDVLEQGNLLGESKEYPNNLILDPSGKALLKSGSKSRVSSIYDVMEVLQEIINLSTQTMKPAWISSNKELVIQRPVIAVESEDPVIVYKVMDGKPGAAGTGPVNAPIRRMVAPILIGKYMDPQDDSSEVYVYGQRLDYNINLSVYAKTAHEADILKEWLADVIKNYLWYVRYSGVIDFTFVQDYGDETEALRHKRTLHYAVSIEKLTWSSFFLLKEFILKLSTS